MPNQNTDFDLISPTHIRLDISTACQLKCPTCPTAEGDILRHLGSSVLKLEHFKSFIDSNPQISYIELSNWGEIFLNKDIAAILRYAKQRNVALTAQNGVNLNTVQEEALEAVVKYGLREINCSIDGASQETYSIYRINGEWDSVIRNIRTINYWKQHYNSSFPRLNWQYIAFAHNEHEISQARKLASELNMSFHLKLAWEDLYGEAFSPIRDKDLLRRENGLGVANRIEYRKKYAKDYVADHICMQMWKTPQINSDGRLLGCAINFHYDYGNVFEEGLSEALNSEMIRYARQMLMGQKEAKPEIACTSCKIYADRKKHNNWITETDILPTKHTASIKPGETEKSLSSNGYVIPISNEADLATPWKPHILFRGTSATTDALQCHCSSLIPGHIPHPPHTHPEEELLIMLSGSADLIWPGDKVNEDQRLSVQKGDFVYYPAYFKHTLQATSEAPANYLMFKWQGEDSSSRNLLEQQHFQALALFHGLNSTKGFAGWVLFEGQTQYLKKLHCHLSVLKPGSGYGEHADHYDVFIIVMEGEIETLGRKFSQNSVIFCAKGYPHGMYNPGSTDAKYIVFEFHGNASC